MNDKIQVMTLKDALQQGLVSFTDETPANEHNGNTRTLFFDGPVELLKGRYPDASATDIMVTVFADETASLEFSPITQDEEGNESSGDFSDAEEFDLSITDAEINALIALAG